MLAKNRNIGHWWRFSGFFNMPNGAFSGRKVLRFFVRFLAFFGVFELPFFAFPAGRWRDPNAWRANLGTPNAGRRKAKQQNFTSKKMKRFLNPAQPLKLFLHLTLNAKNQIQFYKLPKTSFFLPSCFLSCFISLHLVNHKNRKNAIHDFCYI